MRADCSMYVSKVWNVDTPPCSRLSWEGGCTICEDVDGRGVRREFGLASEGWIGELGVVIGTQFFARGGSEEKSSLGRRGGGLGTEPSLSLNSVSTRK